MVKFLKNIFRFSLICSLPFLILLSSYIYFDPFKVIRDYDDYSFPFVIPNRDYVSTSVFIKNYKREQYDSFILGSSRTLAFKPSSWKNYLDEKSKPFMFDASKESIYGIYTKLRFLDTRKIPIKNALILFCRDVTFKEVKNHSGHLFIKHPDVSNESKFKFHLEFFKAYLDVKFLFNFYAYKISGDYKSYMIGYIEKRKITFDKITNEINILDQEKEINESPEKYYQSRKDIFYKRTIEITDNENQIKAEQLFFLNQIKVILEKNKTNYKIVLSPLYEQKKFSKKDIKLLKNMFGEKIYDFSGKNFLTDDKHNYYETSHFRPKVGNLILEKIYQ